MLQFIDGVCGLCHWRAYPSEREITAQCDRGGLEQKPLKDKETEPGALGNMGRKGGTAHTMAAQGDLIQMESYV